MILKPLPPLYEQDNIKSSNDKAKNGFSLRALERLLAADDDWLDWQNRTEIAFAYYDGDNVTQEMQKRARAYGFTETRNKNLIARVVNTVLGQEEKSRRDPKLDADSDEGADVAEVLNVKLKEAQRETNADQEIGSSYSSQVKGGLGWCGVSRRADPFKYQYAVEDIPWREMRYDRRAKRIDLSDAAWICRAQWKDLGDVIAIYPECEEVLRQSINGLATWANDGPIDDEVNRVQYSTERSATYFRTRRAEWMEGTRERIRMYEVEYKVPALQVVMRVGSRWIIVDKNNPAHVEAISRGMVQMKKVPTDQIRRSIFAGPIRLSDEATQLKRFSKVPYFAFRRDIDQSPYGLIEGMIAPQDDYNDASMRMRWMLQAQQLVLDRDALATEYNSIEDIQNTMMRPDMVAILNENRRNTGRGLDFNNNFQIKQELFAKMQDSHKLVQDVPGIYNASMGNGQPGTSSGIAISSLVEQGMVSMGELNGNYTSSRRATFELLVDLIAEDHVERNMVVRIGSGPSRRKIVLNTQDPETGKPMNMVKDAGVKLGLGEVPSSPAYMLQQSQQIGEMIRALGATPQAAVLIPSWVEQTSAFGPDRKRIAEDMRKISGLPSPGDKQGAENQQAQLQQQQAQQAEQQAIMMQAKAQAEMAAARKAMAEAVALEQLLEAGVPVEQGLADVLKTKSDAFESIEKTRAAKTMQPEQDEEAMIAQALAEAMD